MLSLLMAPTSWSNFHLFADDAVGPEKALGQGKPAGGLVAPEGREFDVAKPRWRIKLDEVLLVVGHGEKSANLSISIKLKQLPPIKCLPNITGVVVITV